MPNYLVIKVEDEKATKSGIIIAQTATREKPSQGIIVAVGGEDNIFKAGQEILFEKYGAIELQVDGEDVKMIDKRDVLAILEN